MPAFIAAVAARECGEVAIVRDAEGDWLREAPLEAGGDCRGEGGSVFKSGAIKRGGVSFGHLKIGSNVLGARNGAAELHVTLDQPCGNECGELIWTRRPWWGD